MVIMEGENEAAARASHEAVGPTVLYTSSHRYVGSVIGLLNNKEEWITPQVQTWVEDDKVLSKNENYCPSKAYVGLV